MELRNEILIDAPAERVRHVLGEGFMQVSEWAAPITASCPLGTAEPGVGVSRACTVAPFGPVKAGVYARVKPDDVGDRLVAAIDPRYTKKASKRKVKPVETIKKIPEPRERFELHNLKGEEKTLAEWAREIGSRSPPSTTESTSSG